MVSCTNRSGTKKECGQDSGQFPRNRILIIHEQHLQSMGCDVRLLRFEGGDNPHVGILAGVREDGAALAALDSYPFDDEEPLFPSS